MINKKTGKSGLANATMFPVNLVTRRTGASSDLKPQSAGVSVSREMVGIPPVESVAGQATFAGATATGATVLIGLVARRTGSADKAVISRPAVPPSRVADSAGTFVAPPISEAAVCASLLTARTGSSDKRGSALGPAVKIPSVPRTAAGRQAYPSNPA